MCFFSWNYIKIEYRLTMPICYGMMSITPLKCKSLNHSYGFCKNKTHFPIVRNNKQVDISRATHFCLQGVSK